MGIVPPGLLDVNEVRRYDLIIPSAVVLQGDKFAAPIWGGLDVEVVVGQHVGEQARPHVALQRLHMVAETEAVGLARLGGHVADVHLQGSGGADGLDDVLHQQVGQDAGEEAARPGHDEIGLQDGPQGLRVGPHPLRPQEDPLDGQAGRRDLRFPLHVAQGSLLLPAQVGAKGHVIQGGGEDPSLHGQHPARLQDGPLEAARDPGHGGDEQVAEAVPLQPSALAEAILEELGGQRLGVGQGGDAVAEVARRQHPQLPPEPSRGAAVVGHGDDGRDVGGVFLEPPEQGGQAVSPADGHHLRTPFALMVSVNRVHHVLARPQERSQQRFGEL